MIDLLYRLFEVAGYEQLSNKPVSHFMNQGQAHFFMLELEEVVFKDIKSLSSFRNDNETIKKFMENFENIVKSKSPSVEKNSSLIIILKVDSLDKLDLYKQQILLLEEDENDLKKFVILYSDHAVEWLLENLDSQSLEDMAYDQEGFDSYFHKGYTPEIEGYVFLLQLFIKLPFLKLQSRDELFRSLDERIQESLGDSDYESFNRLLEFGESLLTFDFEKGPDSILDKILEIIDDD